MKENSDTKPGDAEDARGVKQGGFKKKSNCSTPETTAASESFKGVVISVRIW